MNDWRIPVSHLVTMGVRGCTRNAVSLCCVALALAFGRPVSAEPTATAAKPIELERYRVQIVVAWGECSTGSPETRQELLRRLAGSVRRYVGEMWEAETVDAGCFSSASAWVERLTAAEAEKMTTPGIDKAYFVGIDEQGLGLGVTGREWDATTNQLGRPSKNTVYRREALVHAMLATVRAVYRPVASVQQSRTETSLAARGGQYPPRDPDWTALRTGQMLEPYYRYLNAERAVERIQAVPWTYLTVNSAVRGRGTCQVLTGLRAPLSARRSRMETLALSVRPQSAATRVSLQSLPPQSKPLGGIAVDVESGQKQAVRQLLSDRQGMVTIDREPNRVQVWLSLYSGRALLARLPLVPGLHAEQTVELPDDSVRLRVEGEISILQADLVDTVARRAVLMASARSRARAGDWPQTDALLKELAETPDGQAFAARLSAIRLPALKTARENKSKNAELRIQKLCEETNGLIGAYLDADKFRALREEIGELRALDAQDKKELDELQKKSGSGRDGTKESRK